MDSREHRNLSMALILLLFPFSGCLDSQEIAVDDSYRYGNIGFRGEIAMPSSGGDIRGGSPDVGGTPRSGTSSSQNPSPSYTPTPSTTDSPPQSIDPSSIKEMPRSYAWYNYESSSNVEFYCDLMVTNPTNPSKSTSVKQNSFWSHEVYFQNGSTAYIGLQDNVDGRRAVFSLWDSTGTDVGNPFDGEGVGYQKIIVYNWKENQKYRVRIKLVNTDSAARYWNGSVEDLETQVVTNLATHKHPLKYGPMNGRQVVWTEYFYPTNICATTYSRAVFSDPVMVGTSGVVSKPYRASVNYGNGPCPLSYVSKVGEQSVSLEMGIGAERKNKNGDRLW